MVADGVGFGDLHDAAGTGAFLRRLGSVSQFSVDMYTMFCDLQRCVGFVVFGWLQFGFWREQWWSDWRSAEVRLARRFFR